MGSSFFVGSFFNLLGFWFGLLWFGLLWGESVVYLKCNNIWNIRQNMCNIRQKRQDSIIFHFYLFGISINILTLVVHKMYWSVWIPLYSFLLHKLLDDAILFPFKSSMKICNHHHCLKCVYHYYILYLYL